MHRQTRTSVERPDLFVLGKSPPRENISDSLKLKRTKPVPSLPRMRIPSLRAHPCVHARTRTPLSPEPWFSFFTARRLPRLSVQTLTLPARLAPRPDPRVIGRPPAEPPPRAALPLGLEPRGVGESPQPRRGVCSGSTFPRSVGRRRREGSC